MYAKLPSSMAKQRCEWTETNDLFIPYHDKEWGVPVHDDRLLFEFLILEGAQAGLSWLTILKRREGYRVAFDNFNAQKITKYSATKKAQLLKDEKIIRNRLKIDSVVSNAAGFLKIQDEFGSFSKYIWGLSKGKSLNRKNASLAKKISQQMSKDLKRRGFNFVGPTICYAFMQATGIMNDHSKRCFRYLEIEALNK
jgi:DNA-3-methyladenine glycosylase I